MPDDLVPLLIGSLVATRLVALFLGGARQERLPYLGLLAADLAALIGARAAGDAGAALGFVAEWVGLVLVIMPGLLDSLEARVGRAADATARRRAIWVARAREIFVPGRGATLRRRSLEHLALAAAGDADRVLSALAVDVTATRDAEHARQLHGERVQLLVAADRAAEAVEHAERHLGPSDFERSPALTAALCRALAAMGRPRDAASLLALLELQAVGRNLAAQPLLGHARLAFIGAAGLGDELERLLAQRAIARDLGRGEAARLRALAVASAAQGDDEIRAVARDLAGRLLEASARASTSVSRRAPLTIALVAVNVAVLVALHLAGIARDELGLARAGALFRPAVLAGEWWRLPTAMFLHADLLHIGANMYALYLLGRAAEDLLSAPRLFVIYVVSGLGGGLASLWADRGLSVGASGAIMGLLAALTVVVFGRRHQFHPTARRMLLGNLLFLGALQAFLGWQIPMIDSAAHAGGFVAGLFATAGLAPTRELSPAARRAIAGLAVALAAGLGVAGVLALRTPLQATLLALPTQTIELDGARVVVPASWRREAAPRPAAGPQTSELVDRHLGIVVRIERDGERIRVLSPQADDARVRPLLARIAEGARPASQPAAPVLR